MANFSEITKYKNNIISAIIGDDLAVRCIANGECDFLAKPYVGDPAELVYKNIFPWRKLPDTQLETKTYITMEFETPRVNRINDLFKDSLIHIYLFSHFQLLRTDYGTRTDWLFNKIDELFNESENFGIGKLQLYANRPIDPSYNHQGYMLTYKAVDANNGKCGGK